MRPDPVLITFGSKLGGTEELADWIASDLHDAGFDTAVRPAYSVGDITRYGAVVVGGGLYAGRWHRDARRFTRKFGRALRERPVWLFSSGPLDSSAEEQAIPPVRSVAQIAERIGARGHETIGGRLEAAPDGVVARTMAKRFAGDHRDREHVRRWASGIADELNSAWRKAASTA
jgi:menaquinone-dependent protoporphyrinogen oxidase